MTANHPSSRPGRERDPDVLLAGHLADALRDHRERYERDGFAVPRAYLSFERICAIAARSTVNQVSKGQAGSLFAIPADPPERGPHDPLLHTFDEAGAMLGVSVSTVKRLVRNGELPKVRVGAAVRVHRDDLVAYADSRRAAS